MMKVVAGLMNFDWKYIQGGLFVIYLPRRSRRIINSPSIYPPHRIYNQTLDEI